MLNQRLGRGRKVERSGPALNLTSRPVRPRLDPRATLSLAQAVNGPRVEPEDGTVSVENMRWIGLRPWAAPPASRPRPPSRVALGEDPRALHLPIAPQV